MLVGGSGLPGRPVPKGSPFDQSNPNRHVPMAFGAIDGMVFQSTHPSSPKGQRSQAAGTKTSNDAPTGSRDSAPSKHAKAVGSSARPTSNRRPDYVELMPATPPTDALQWPQSPFKRFACRSPTRSATTSRWAGLAQAACLASSLLISISPSPSLSSLGSRLSELETSPPTNEQPRTSRSTQRRALGFGEALREQAQRTATTQQRPACFSCVAATAHWTPPNEARTAIASHG